MTLSITGPVLVVNGDIGWPWSSPVPITNLTADQILMIDWQIVGAATFGATNAITITLLKGTNIVFTTVGSGAFVGGWSGNQIHSRNAYAAQFSGLDDRGGPISARRGYYQDPVAPIDVSPTFQTGKNIHVAGTFTAINSTQQIIENLLGTPSGTDAGNGDINALVVRLAPAVLAAGNNGNGTVTISWN